MNFSWSRAWDWTASWGESAFVAHKSQHASISVRERLVVNMPFGRLRIAGTDAAQAEIEIRVKSRHPDQAAGVGYVTRDRDGVTEIQIDGPLRGAGTVAKVEVDLWVPRRVALDVTCGMGSLLAANVGPIVVHANMGAVEIDGAQSDVIVRANMGSTKVRLAPQWRGSRIDVNCNMGKALLAVPHGVALDCTATSTMGKVEMKVGAVHGAPSAIVRANMGSATIVPA